MKRLMRSVPTTLIVILLVLALVPAWTGEPRLDLFDRPFVLRTTRVVLDPANPAHIRLGKLVFLGGVALSADVPAFGGFSSLSVRGDRFTLLSDGGTIVRFRMGSDWHPHHATYQNLPGGPGTGWQKQDRDSESMTSDPDGRIWVGFERWNAIGRYAPGFTRMERLVQPRSMADWDDNGGAESMVRLRDGRFVVIAEQRRDGHGMKTAREGLVFAQDPTTDPRPVFRFTYQAPRHYDPSDITELPDGRLLVLNRRFALPFAFSAKLAIVKKTDLKPGGNMRVHEIAAIAAPLTSDNYEGLAITREGDSTIVWLVSDDNQTSLQRSLLLKFRLDAGV